MTTEARELFLAELRRIQSPLQDPRVIRCIAALRQCVEQLERVECMLRDLDPQSWQAGQTNPALIDARAALADLPGQVQIIDGHNGNYR